MNKTILLIIALMSIPITTYPMKRVLQYIGLVDMENRFEISRLDGADNLGDLNIIKTDWKKNPDKVTKKHWKAYKTKRFHVYYQSIQYRYGYLTDVDISKLSTKQKKEHKKKLEKANKITMNFITIYVSEILKNNLEIIKEINEYIDKSKTL